MAERLGPSNFRRRLHSQGDLRARLIHQGEGPLVIERAVPVDRIIGFMLRVAGLRARAVANCLDVRLVTREQPLPNLPEAFDGFRLLQLSDLHLDLVAGFADVVTSRIRAVPHDLAVITGDFADHPAGYFHACLGDLRRIARALGPGALAVLGNHDILEIVPHLEEAGIRVLLNESARIERNGSSLWIAGIDDPHFYRTHDLRAARSNIPHGDCSILLSHSPETYDDAARLGFDFMLSGHTHAGQICLPGGFAIVRNGRCPKAQFAGPWTHGKMRGYTSRGTGSCGVAARFNCPPELTVHVLRAAGS
ncbi:MAG: metallophosphoesterase [Chthoniobacterales bacterium]|nr:metallophosphoesterase [Chthoniobacterales bacterium]